MTSPETLADKEPINKCMIMLMAANILIAAAAVSFVVENPKEVNNLPTQAIGYQSFENGQNR